MKIMKYPSLLFRLTVCLTVLLLVACTKDPVESKPNIQLRITVSTAGEQTVVTRAGADETLTDLYVVVFSDNSDDATITDWTEASAIGSSTYFASLKSTTVSGTAYVFANIAGMVSGSGFDWGQPGLTLSGTKSALAVSLRTSNGYIVENPTFSPMVSEGVEYNNSMDQISVSMHRSTSKVTVTDETNNTKFALLGCNMGNASGKGYIFSGLTTSNDVKNYAGLVSGATYSPEVMICGISADNAKQTQPLYLFEGPATNKPFVIIKCEYDGVTGYHRLNLWNRDTKEYYAVDRNYRYEVKIAKIFSAGYKTAQEAIEAESQASNSDDILFDVEVKDPVSQDIVSNGDYYLGLSNSSFLLYSADELKDHTVASVAHNAPAGVRCEVTATTVSGTGSLTFNNPFAQAADGTVKTADLQISIPSTVDKADVILRVGNLSRRFAVERIRNATAFGGTVLIGSKYVHGLVSEGNDQWLRLSTETDIAFEDALPEYTNDGTQEKELYMVLASNVVLEGSATATRQAELNVFEADEQGHTRILVCQPSFEIFGPAETNTGKIENPYVGAFWRHDQTGERVIKMNILGSADQLSWDAQVAVGQDWIRLEKGGSTDKAIYTPTAMLGDDASFEATHQLSSGAGTSISGEKADVIFRIGLTGNKKYPDGKLSKDDHRYGLVIVNTYVDHVRQNTYRIFVRQGDAPDYVFRTTDSGYDDWGAGEAVPRSKSVKISPYNLTDPNRGIGNSEVIGDLATSLSKHNPMVLDYYNNTNPTFNPREFTDFPSQAGYLFVWNQTASMSTVPEKNLLRAFHPLNNVSLAWTLSLGEDLTYSPLEYDEQADPCPYGYRTPTIGVRSGKTTDKSADKSELIQSLLYDPLAPTRGNSAAIMAKYTLWGYYADGFFDRLPINTDALTPHWSVQHRTRIAAQTMAMRGTDVKKLSGNDIAYTGQLIFNPYNYSSIFFPATGRLLPGSEMSAVGSSTFIWTSQRILYDSSSKGCYPLDMNGQKTQFFIYASQGAVAQFRSVRCVRDYTKWPTNGE